MQVEHVAIDGSVVELEADANLSSKATATGWAISPALMRAHPFVIHPPGHSTTVEQAVRSGGRGVNVRSTEDYSVKDGRLRVGVVELQTPTGEPRQITVGAWEGDGGCLSTSLAGTDAKKLVEVFDTLHFSRHRDGLGIDSPVVPRPRTPEVATVVPGVGVIAVRPAIPTELERIPSGQGQRTRHGELFRAREGTRALIFVTRSSVVSISPTDEAGADHLVQVADSLNTRWRPRERGATR